MKILPKLILFVLVPLFLCLTPKVYAQTNCNIGDFDNSGEVDSADFILQAGHYSEYGASCESCPCDLNGDDKTNGLDLGGTIRYWSLPSVPTSEPPTPTPTSPLPTSTPTPTSTPVPTSTPTFAPTSTPTPTLNCSGNQSQYEIDDTRVASLRMAQSFSPTASGDLEYLSLCLSEEKTLIVDLYEDDGDFNGGSGDVLVATSVNSQTAGDCQISQFVLGKIIQVDFKDTELAAGENYIFLPRSISGASIPAYAFETDPKYDNYPKGMVYEEQMGPIKEWVPNSDLDYYFDISLCF